MKRNLPNLRKEVDRILKASGCTIGLRDEVDSEFKACEQELRGVKKAVDSFKHDRRYMEGRTITIKEFLGEV